MPGYSVTSTVPVSQVVTIHSWSDWVHPWLLGSRGTSWCIQPVLDRMWYPGLTSYFSLTPTASKKLGLFPLFSPNPVG